MIYLNQFFKKKFSEIKKIRYKNYVIWKQLCKKNKSIEIIKRNFDRNSIPWVFFLPMLRIYRLEKNIQIWVGKRICYNFMAKFT